MSAAGQSDDEFFDTRGTLEMWVRAIVIVALICTAFLAAALSSTYGATIVGTGMYTVIGLVGVLAIWQSYCEARFIDRQMRLASEQLAILESVNTLDEFFVRSEASIFRRHIANLHAIASVQRSVSQDNLIEILHERLLSRNQVVELFASVLITLGLIGTIVGLIFMMNSLALVMSESAGSADLLPMLTREGGPLSGLGVAFYTTLIGATLGGVLLRILTSVVDASIGKYTAHMAEITEVHVLPYMRTNMIDKP